MLNVQRLSLPSTFLSNMQESGLCAFSKSKDPLYMQTSIAPDGIRLRAYHSSNGTSLGNIMYPALSVNLRLPLINDYGDYDVFEPFHELVSSMDLDKTQIQGQGKKTSSDRWLAFFGVDHQGKALNNDYKIPFIVDSVRPDQMVSLLRVAEEYFHNNTIDSADRVLLRYTAEFSNSNLRKTIIQVREANSPGFGTGTVGDIDYFISGETHKDISVSVQIGHVNIETKEGNDRLNSSWYDRHPVIHRGVESTGLGLEGTIILMSKRGFLEQAK